MYLLCAANLQASWELLDAPVIFGFFVLQRKLQSTLLQRWANPCVIIPLPHKLQVSCLSSPTLPPYQFSWQFFIPYPIWTIKQMGDEACETKHTGMSFTPIFPNTISTQEHHPCSCTFCSVFMITFQIISNFNIEVLSMLKSSLEMNWNKTLDRKQSIKPNYK